MNVALFGYGKMGKAIEQVAIARGHTVPLKIDSANAGCSLEGCDVVIEFTKPDQSISNMRSCLEAGVPIVVGTTGWYDQLAEVKAMVQANNGSLLWASNFSIGVNLFFRVNKFLAGLLNDQPGYGVHIDEVHHIHKLDAPSGTAITLARDIDLKNQRYSGWVGTSVQPGSAPSDKSRIPIASERTGDVPGKHSVTWASAEDKITITHDAFGRQGFATGAVVAAEWLKGKKGFFTMDDVLDLSR